MESDEGNFYLGNFSDIYGPEVMEIELNEVILLSLFDVFNENENWPKP
jgi:hypothetical protein